jgi:histidyl-tRNA synthetase
MDKPTLPKGTRDFGPAQMAKRQFIFDSIKKVFQKYGFQPLETPAMENLSTLTGKYGEEGDQLLFKVLESGDYIKKTRKDVVEKKMLDDKLRYYFNTIILENFNSLRSKGMKEFDHSDFNFQPYNSTKDWSHETAYYLQAQQIIKDHIDQANDLLTKVLKDPDFIEAFNLSNKLYETISPYYINNLQVEQILNPKTLSTEISEKGLRYDLTVPFARYVVMNRHEITFPFKRYQLQPVWRADRPQKGRYREFYQCDADVVGTNSLICEAEIVLMIKEVFNSLGIKDYSIKINHRGVLGGLAELSNSTNHMSLFVAIDKLDKIGESKVKEELISRGFNESSLETVFKILNFKGTTEEKITFLLSQFPNSDTGKKGVNDLQEVFSLLKNYGASDDHVEFDIALARGLSYYTGCIFEVKINNVAIGSVSGGGRYDNLTGGFGLPDVSGVGISFGVDRLYDAMEELNLFPQEAQISSKVLLCHFDEESKMFGLKLLQSLRANGIASEIYPDKVKIQKQLEYANKKMIPYTIVIGSDEVKSGLLAFKNMKTGEQEKLSFEQILSNLKINN